MEDHNLYAISPIDGRYHDKTSELASFFSESALIYYRLYTEIKWLIHLANCDAIEELPKFSDDEIYFLDGILAKTRIEISRTVKEIENTINHDVKAVEYYLASELKKHESLGEYIPFIHFGCTSEDINNVCYNLMIRDSINSCITNSYQSVYNKIKMLSDDNYNLPMISRTHGQPASPTTLGKELNVFYVRLSQAFLAFDEMQQYTTKFSGAVGNYNAHILAYPNIDWLQVTQDFITSLGLVQHDCTTQIEPHDNISQIMLQCTRINNVLLDFAKDMWGYISLGYFKQRSVANEVGSSTMPHKVNPIDFENAEGNLGMANALFYHLASKLPISRYQRDLTDSTTMRSIGVAFAYTQISLKSLEKGLSKVEANKIKIAEELDDNWQLVTEGIQTLLRKHKVENAYEMLKDLSRNKHITKDSLHNWIKELPIPKSDVDRLLELKPSDYIGISKIST